MTDHRSASVNRADRPDQIRRLLTMHLVAKAVASFGGEYDGVFNTAGIQQAVEKITGVMPAGSPVIEFLAAEPRIVRLHGGNHWMLLPGGHERHEG